MTDPFERLQEARLKAGHETATDAARAYGWNETTYRSHENGTRGLRKNPAERYAKAFRVPVEWIMLGKGRAQPQQEESQKTVPLVGYVAAGAETHFLPGGELDRVTAPQGSTDDTVAVEIRGESLGSFFDRWLIFYDQVRRPVTSDLIGRLCVVGLPDGRILVKRIRKARGHGLFHLESQTEGTIFDVPIEWAAKVKNMVPR